jgi:Icc protein
MGTSSASNVFRVLHITDPHLFADRGQALREAVSWQTLVRVLRHYGAGDWRADLVYLTGDLIHDDTRQAYRNLRELVDGIGLPVHVVPGNHDVPALLREELPDYPCCSTVDVAGWRLLGISTYEDGVASGSVGKDTLDRLRSTLADSDRPAAIFMHHPPVELGSDWLDGVGLADRDAFLDVVRESEKVRVVVFGHVHQAYDNGESGLRILGTPSTCRQFRPHSATFAVDDNPPAYRRLEFHADGGFSTRLVWVDS